MLVHVTLFPFGNIFSNLPKTVHHLNHILIVVCKCFSIWASPHFLHGKGLTHSHTMTLLTFPGKKPFQNIVDTSIFSFSHEVFYSNKERNYHLCNIYFVVCKCFQFGQGQIFVIWKWVKAGSPYHKGHPCPQ